MSKATWSNACQVSVITLTKLSTREEDILRQPRSHSFSLHHLIRHATSALPTYWITPWESRRTYNPLVPAAPRWTWPWRRSSSPSASWREPSGTPSGPEGRRSRQPCRDSWLWGEHNSPYYIRGREVIQNQEFLWLFIPRHQTRVLHSEISSLMQL